MEQQEKTRSRKKKQIPKPLLLETYLNKQPLDNRFSSFIERMKDTWNLDPYHDWDQLMTIWHLFALFEQKGEKGALSDLEYFNRIKKDKKLKQYEKNIIYDRKYFDTETFEYYVKNEETGEYSEEPIIVPYLIGVYDEWTDDYKPYEGIDSCRQFLQYISDYNNWQKSKDKQTTVHRELLAFNIDYDFCVVRPFIEKYYKDTLGYNYKTTDGNKFLFGDLELKKLPSYIKHIKIKLVDLWRWDQAKSLEKYLSYILSVTYKDKTNEIIEDTLEDGTTVTNKHAQKLHDKLKSLKYDKDSFRKLIQLDKKKINLEKREDGNYYYWTSLEDLKAGKAPIKLDLKSELEYLKNDVKTLAAVRLEQELYRERIIEILKITDIRDPFFGLGIPAFGKYCLEEYKKKYCTEDLRFPIPKYIYEQQERSYTGAFVAGNKDIVLMEEEIFKQLYPNESFYRDGKPIIQSYDVNSMYPWAMSTGLPEGDVYRSPLKDWKTPSEYPNLKPYVTWYEIEFEGYIDEFRTEEEIQEDKKRGIHKRLYKWKSKYAYLNNRFFGDTFEKKIVIFAKDSHPKYVPDFIWELFDSMCIHKAKVVGKKYQKMSFEHIPFVNTLYEIKANREGKHSKATKELIKLLLNSLYGKLAERYKNESIEHVHSLEKIVQTCPSYQEALCILNLQPGDDLLSKIQKTEKGETTIKAAWKQNISKHYDQKTGNGFLFKENVSHRYRFVGDEGEITPKEYRESITAGMYITWKSRWLLLSSIKTEIDRGNVVLYCDTDSIKLIARKPPIFECDEYELGAWKLEGFFTHFGHPNKKKKYFMFNADMNDPEKAKLFEKQKQWMIKTSGAKDSYLKTHNDDSEDEFEEDLLKTKNADFNIEDIKIIFNPKNRILIKDCKNTPYRNNLYQPVIRHVDLKFVWGDKNIEEPTHTLKNNNLIEHE